MRTSLLPRSRPCRSVHILRAGSERQGPKLQEIRLKQQTRRRVVVWTSGNSAGDKEPERPSSTPPEKEEVAAVVKPVFGSAVKDILSAEDVEHEADLSPLRSALKKAEQRVQDASFQRESLETEAQDVCEIAIRAKEEFAEANLKMESLLKESRKRTEQLTKMEQQRALSISELDRLQAEFGDKLTPDMVATSPLDSGSGDWDAPSGMRGSPAGEPPQLSEEAEAITQRRAAVLIIRERASAMQKELSNLQQAITECTDRVAAAEIRYKQADQVASGAMLAAEAAVHDELEARAVSQQVKSALTSAIASLKALDSSSQAEEAIKIEAALAAAEPVAVVKDTSIADKTMADLDEIIATDDELDPESVAAAETEAKRALLKAKLPFALLCAVLVAAFAFTQLGPWLSNEFEVFSLFAQKVSAVFSAIVDKIPWPQPHHGEEGLYITIAILLVSVVTVPLVMNLIPGGSSVLGFLIGGAILGPHGMAVVQDVEGVRLLAEMGVVFLLFNIGLELSLDRLHAMAKAVFGMGGLQFVLTTLMIAGIASFFGGYSGPASIILGGGLALSSTAVAMQVLQERQESGARHGRATFAVLLLQDLAVVVLLMLVPLLGDAGGLSMIAKALAIAGVKAVVCITTIILGGRLVLRPLFRRVAALENAEIFAATTLLVILGTSVMTQIAGLSLALGAFLAGLLMAETEYALQVESDIAPFKGLLMGLFFISVGMEISLGILFEHWPIIFGSLVALIVGKTAVMALIGPTFGVSRLSAIRSGFYLAPGGEFAFVVLNEAVGSQLIPASHIPIIFFMVVLSMALTPYLAAAGAHLAKMFETTDVTSLQPSETETAELKNHVVIMGFGRVGQTIAQLLSERLIPFVALDVRVERVQAGKALDLPVYFGDAGSPAVLHLLGADRARCAVITLDTPGANYRAVWAMNKHFPHAKIYVRAHDIEHGLNLEKAGATAVVPEILEPSLQLAAAVLSSMQMKEDDISDAIDTFRRAHLQDLRELTEHSGGSLGYGYSPNETSKGEDPLGDDGSKTVDVIMAKPA